MLIWLCISIGISIMIASAAGLIGIMDNSDNNKDNSESRKIDVSYKQIKNEEPGNSNQKEDFSKDYNTLVLSTEKIAESSKADIYCASDKKVQRKVYMYKDSKSATERSSEHSVFKELGSTLGMVHTSSSSAEPIPVVKLQVQYSHQGAKPKIHSSDSDQFCDKSSEERSQAAELQVQYSHQGVKPKVRTSDGDQSCDKSSEERNQAAELQVQYLHQGAKPKVRTSDGDRSCNRSNEGKGKGKHDKGRVSQTHKPRTRRKGYRKSRNSYEKQVASELENLHLIDTLHDQGVKEDISKEIVKDTRSVVNSQSSDDVFVGTLCSAYNEDVEKDKIFSNEIVLPTIKTFNECPGSYIEESLTVQDVFTNKQKSIQVETSGLMIDVAHNFQKTEIFQRLPDDVYRRKQSYFSNMLKRLKDMHFCFCIDVMGSIFYAHNDFICIHESSILFLMHSTQYYQLCLSILKVSCMVQLGSMLNIPKVINSFIYNFKSFKSSRDFDMEFINMLYCLQNERQNLREKIMYLYKSRDYVSFYMQDREILPPWFFNDLLKMLCEFVSLRLTGSGYYSTSLVDFIIVSTAMVLGTMYVSYRCMFNSRNDSRGVKSFFDLIDAMGIKDTCKGNLGLACYNILKIFLHMYNSNNNDLRVIGNMYFPRSLVQKCSEFFISKVECNINNNTMSFGVVLEDLSLIICGLVDRCNIIACSNEILAYDMMYSQLINETAAIPGEQDNLAASRSDGRSL